MAQNVQSGLRYFALLEGHQFMNLITFRKNGEAVKTPVWFAVDEDTLYVMTAPNAGKLKRIGASSRVLVGPCDMVGRPLGDTVEARARILDREEGEVAWRHLYRKYATDIRRLFGQIDAAKRVYIAVCAPAETDCQRPSHGL